MRYAYAKMTFHMMLVSFLALILIGCGESGTPGGASGPGVTASIALSAGTASLPADGVSSTSITAVLTDSVGASVYPQTSIVFRTNLGTFRNGAKEYRTTTADEAGRVVVQLTAEEITGNAEVWVESNKVKQKVEVNFFDPHKVGTISLRTGSASIKADGVSQVAVTATVTDAQGNPEAGAEVKFNTTLGQFYEENPIDPSILNQNTTAVTDVDGEAVVMLISGKTIGTATILATLNGLNTTANVVFTAGEPETISLRAAPSTIRPKGTTQLFAKLQDINGNPVEGSTIVFSQMINASEGALNSLSAATNVNGEAQVAYTAGKDPGADIIQAALSSDLNMKATTTIVVDPGATVIGGITVTAGSPSIVADGISTVKIRATVTDVDGNPASSKTVTFRTTAGTLSSATAITSDIGLAEITLQASTIAGPATVIAECDGFIGEAVVEFVPGPAHHIIMYASPNVVPPNGPFTTSAIIQDQYDNRIDDQRLMLQVRRAGYTEIVDSAELTPDQAEDGVFRFDWTAATAYGPGNLEITAKVNNGVSKTVTVVVDEAAIIVGSITVTAGAEAIKANGVDSTTIRAIVLDYNNKPAQGIKVNFTTTLGSLSTSQEVTDQNGIAEIRLTSGTTWGTATVTADANGFKGQTVVRFTSGQAGGVSLTALPSTVQPGGQATIIAEINNGSGAPVVGETLYFNLYDNNTNASLSSVQGVSDVNGRATVTYTGGIIEGLDSIRVTAASDSRITATTRVRVVIPTGSVGSITLTSAQPSLPADGKSSTALTATVFDTAGIAMPEGTIITLNTTLGTFPGGVDPDGVGPLTSQVILSITGTDGKIVTSLISSATPGSATVTATSGGVSQSLIVAMTGGAGWVVSKIELIIENTTLNADGISQTNVYAYAKTEQNQAVPGVDITFETSHGTITTPHKTDASGKATAVLTSSRENINPVTVTARYNLVSGTATMKFSGVTLILAAAPSAQVLGQDSTITATLRDAANRPISGATVSFSTDKAGAIVVPATARTNAVGEAIVALQNSTAAGDIKVTGTFGTAPNIVQGFVTVNFGEYQLSFEALPLEPAAGPGPAIITIGGGPSGTSTITVRLRQYGPADCPSGFVTPFTAYFSTTLGTITASSVTGPCTDAAGYIYADASATLTSGVQGGTAIIDAYAEIGSTRYEATTSVTITSPTANKIILEADPNVISVNAGTSTIRARVLDANDNPVANKTIYFRVTEGPGGSEYLSPSIAITNSDGFCSVIFYAGSITSDNIGDVTIEASDNQAFTDPAKGSCNLTIAGPVHHISVGVNLQELPSPAVTQGHLKVGVSGIPVDINGNPVADGTQVFFSVTSIEFDEDRADDDIIEYWSAPGQLPGDLISSCTPPPACPPPPGIIGINYWSDDIDGNGFLNLTGSEDKNNNGILDTGEDLNGNGVMDPPQGNLIVSPKSTVNGVATTDLIYPMQYAENIKVRITATAGGKTNFYDYELLCTEDMVDANTCGREY